MSSDANLASVSRLTERSVAWMRRGCIPHGEYVAGLVIDLAMVSSTGAPALLTATVSIAVDDAALFLPSMALRAALTLLAGDSLDEFADRSHDRIRSRCWFKPTSPCDDGRGYSSRAVRPISDLNMKTIVINNQKGGVGKTTLAVHLAWFMAETNLRVLVIDVDAQSNASDTLRHYAGSTLAADLFKPGIRVVPRDDEGLTLAPADSSLTDLDRSNADAITTLQENLAIASDQFDACVIDTPPSLGLRSVGCLVAASHVLAPIYLEDYSIKGVKGLMQTVIGVQRRYGRQDTKFLGLLPSNFNTKSPRQRTHLEQLLREAGKYVFPGQIVARDGYAEAVAERLPVWKLKRRSAQEAGREIRAVVAKIVAQMAAAANGA
ncbi:ParA family protein [Bradyrhizobium japonicum]|uniref:ParA family protein n=1 Tax=Bradyrhizobium japonicum TaxID=375 RepID=UPI00200F4157|nr:ParA family protein [Bradyrhizobium japonicum]WLB24659.1 ParA family protein [Bradyrhizobium japonicum]